MSRHDQLLVLIAAATFLLLTGQTDRSEHEHSINGDASFWFLHKHLNWPEPVVLLP